VPGIETSLPLMLTAYKNNLMSLNTLVKLMHDNPKIMFNLADNDDVVFANIEDYKPLDNNQLCTKVKWSPYTGMNLTGYPEYVYTNGQLFHVRELN
jgi:dihydroorotase